MAHRRKSYHFGRARRKLTPETFTRLKADTIRAEIARVQKRIAAERDELRPIAQKAREEDGIRSKLNQIASEMRQLERGPGMRHSIVQWALTRSKLTPEGQRRLAELRAQYLAQEQRLKRLEPLGWSGAVSAIQERIAAAEAELRALEGALKIRIELDREKREEVERKKAFTDARKRVEQEKLDVLRAAAAAAHGKTREAAGAIKKRLPRQAICPYCGGSLGADAHVDHIYPVSKGGRSTPANMVHVCAICNLKKKDRTLRVFIKEFGLNREAIESRLAELAKDF